MECLFYYGGSRKHRYKAYKTLFFRTIKYSCDMCGSKITEAQYKDWQEMHIKKNALIKQYLQMDRGRL
jgi:hypothetical protein